MDGTAARYEAEKILAELPDRIGDVRETVPEPVEGDRSRQAQNAWITGSSLVMTTFP
jgi:hypothetical protein